MDAKPLKRCPFCGSCQLVAHREVGNALLIRCMDCRAKGPPIDDGSYKLASQKWNERTCEPKQP